MTKQQILYQQSINVKLMRIRLILVDKVKKFLLQKKFPKNQLINLKQSNNKKSYPNKPNKSKFVYFTKSLYRQFVLLITKKFVQSAQFLDSIGVMSLKVFRRFKSKKINVTFQSFLFLRKSNKLSNECVTNKPNQGLLKFWIKKETYFKNKFDRSSES